MKNKDKRYDTGKTFILVRLVDNKVVFDFRRTKDERLIDSMEIEFKLKKTARNYFASVTEASARLMIDHAVKRKKQDK